MGALQTWELTCELFEYSNEVFNTGVPQIDSIQVKLSTNILDYLIVTEEDSIPLVTEDGAYYLVNEALSLNAIVPGSNNTDLKNESDRFIDFTAVDPFTEGI